MYNNDNYEHKLVCVHCGNHVLCEDPDCFLPPMHEGVCEECSYYKFYGFFDNITYATG